MSTDFPIAGSWAVHVSAVRPFTIHGDVYYEVQGTRVADGGGAALSLRVPQHAVATARSAGQTVTVTFLMGQVTAVRPA